MPHLDREIGLEFLENSGGEAEGLSEAGIETFRDRPFASVARETGQNSRDARLEPSKPVRLTFDVIKLKSADFPSIEQFRESVGLCLAKSKGHGKEKEKGFFEQAAKVLQGDEIEILRISDHNTKGAQGPCIEGKPFHTLAKTDGGSAKDEINSGGSFGIGKNAVFALSDIQTAFFSTRYKDEQGAENVLCMGKTLFISHRGSDGRERRRKGYWGRIAGFAPLDDAAKIPAWLHRDELGTSIFSIGMRHNAIDWRHEMTAAILINFFCAIQRGEMEFELDNGHRKINRSTIEALFVDPEVLEAVSKLNLKLRFDAAKILLQCVVDPKATEDILEIDGLGKVRLRTLLRDGLGYTIGIVRNGMYITDNFANFNEPFKRFPLHRDFATLIEPVGPVEGEWFKRLENPRHDDLSAERITDPALRVKGQRAFQKLAKQVRERIRQLAKSEPEVSLDLDELSDFFAADGARQDDDGGTETDPRMLKPTPVNKAPPKKRRASPRPGDDDESDPTEVGPEVGTGPEGGGSGGSGGNESPGTRPDGSRTTAAPAARDITLVDERNVIPDRNAPSRRRIFFTVPLAGTISLSVAATGLSTPEQLFVVSADRGRIVDGRLEIEATKGERVSVEAVFDSPYSGPIEISASVMPQLGAGGGAPR